MSYRPRQINDLHLQGRVVWHFLVTLSLFVSICGRPLRPYDRSRPYESAIRCRSWPHHHVRLLLQGLYENYRRNYSLAAAAAALGHGLDQWEDGCKLLKCHRPYV